MSSTNSERAAKATANQERARRYHARRAKIAERIERMAYSINEVSLAIGRDPATIHRWVKSGKIASIKVGGARLIPAAELKRLSGQ